ncbi:MAG: PDZ domain-containing protein [Pirellulales bacterium]|nr:PDZ domain-containing protein [Pirellulales bacterium]
MLVRSLAALAVVGVAAASAQAQDAAKNSKAKSTAKVIVATVVEDGNATLKAIPNAKHLFATPVGKYWIGVHCYPASPVLRAQLGLGEGEGVVVGHVMKDSPADKAGLKKHDLLLAVGDEKLSNQMQLAKAVEKAGDKAVTLKYMRAGKEKTVEMKPAERKAARTMAFDLRSAPGFDVDRKAIEKWLKEMRGGEGRALDAGPLKMRVFGPGVVIGDAAKMPKEGDKPAKIRVMQGDKSWEIEDGQWDKLPEDLRPHVRRFLGKGRPSTATIRSIFADRALPAPKEIKDLDIRVERLFPKGADGLSPNDLFEFQMQEMNERLEQMQKDIDRLLNNRNSDEG